LALAATGFKSPSRRICSRFAVSFLDDFQYGEGGPEAGIHQDSNG